MVRKIVWTAPARAEVRAIDRHTALDLLHGIARFLVTGEGDVKRLKNIDPAELRLRVGDYRVRFCDRGKSIVILQVSHRKDAYR